MKSILETKVSKFIGLFWVRLENHYGGWHVSKTDSGHNLIISGFVRVSQGLGRKLAT
jgi:hypothetical protein